MKHKRSIFPLLVVLACLAMGWVETVPQPPYAVKSALKWLVFGGCVLLGSFLFREKNFFAFLRMPNWKNLRPALVLSGLAVTAILGGYALLASWLDLSTVTGNLGVKEGITAATFPFVALYISLGNSFLEEFFFRGFAFLTLRESGCPRLAQGFSALAFALYHVTIMGSWFHPVLFVLFTAALAAAGVLFNLLDRCGSIWPGWLVHMAANLAINTIGMRLFGIL